MAHIQIPELRSLARASRLSLEGGEERLTRQLDEVLTYMGMLTQYTYPSAAELATLPQQALVCRPDETVATDSSTFLSRAPQQESHFFVVPLILSHDK